MKTTLFLLISVAACALQPPVRRAAPRTQLAASGNADAAAPIDGARYQIAPP